MSVRTGRTKNGSMEEENNSRNKNLQRKDGDGMNILIPPPSQNTPDPMLLFGGILHETTSINDPSVLVWGALSAILIIIKA